MATGALLLTLLPHPQPPPQELTATTAMATGALLLTLLPHPHPPPQEFIAMTVMATGALLLIEQGSFMAPEVVTLWPPQVGLLIGEPTMVLID